MIPTKLVTLLEQLHIDYALPGKHHHTTSGWINIDCPYCGFTSGTRSRYKCGISIYNSKLVAHCWECGNLSAIQVIAKLTGRPIGFVSETIAKIIRQEGGCLLTNAPSPTSSPRRLLLPLPQFPLVNHHKQYLLSRGFDPSDIVRMESLYGIRSLLLAFPECYSHSIFIPILDVSGNLVNYQIRRTNETTLPKYLSCSNSNALVNIKRLLFGIQLCSSRNTILVVEGPLDAMRIGPGALALMGVQYSNTQVKILSRFSTRYICLDQDANFQARELCDQLSTQPGRTYLIELETGKDPTRCSRKELAILRRLVNP